MTGNESLLPKYGLSEPIRARVMRQLSQLEPEARTQKKVWLHLRLVLHLLLLTLLQSIIYLYRAQHEQRSEQPPAVHWSQAKKPSKASTSDCENHRDIERRNQLDWMKSRGRQRQQLSKWEARGPFFRFRPTKKEEKENQSH
jgi:hypothetical protein